MRIDVLQAFLGKHPYKRSLHISVRSQVSPQFSASLTDQMHEVTVRDTLCHTSIADALEELDCLLAVQLPKLDEEVRKLPYCSVCPVYFPKDEVPQLQIVYEDMQEHYGEAWDMVPKNKLIYHCPQCGEVGTLSEMEKFAAGGSKRKLARLKELHG